MKIYPGDGDYWKHWLQDDAVYISETAPTADMMEHFELAVLLAKNLDARIYQNKHTIDGLRYESPEDLCVEFLKDLIAEVTVMEILAILLIQRNVFKWDYFCRRITTLGMARAAGILLEVINEHTKQNLIPQRVIDRLFHGAVPNDFLKNSYYPYTWRVKTAVKRKQEKSIPINYPEISQKWQTKVVLPLYIMEKLELDLDYAWRNQTADNSSEVASQRAAKIFA